MFQNYKAFINVKIKDKSIFYENEHKMVLKVVDEQLRKLKIKNQIF